VFNEPALSHPAGQACADCHQPYRAFSDPETDSTTSQGVVDGRFGSRNAPSAMYARYVPSLTKDATGAYHGGLFWDGRGGSLEQQAGFPLLNPAEMANPDHATVAKSIRAVPYAKEFHALYGAGSLDNDDAAFTHVADAIAAYERSPVFAPFSSKYDRYLAKTETLTAEESRGLAIFEDPARGNCASCHPSRPSADGTPPLFTDFSYANLGIPHYRNSKYYDQNPAGADFIDHGLMQTTNDAAQDGKFRTPTLRNIATTGPYGHNGYFDNLPYMLDFIATRDRAPIDTTLKPWKPPEVATTLDHRVGNLPLTQQDLDDLAAFLGTLSDQLPHAPPPQRR
jgi:cytochrome c peroxidase